ncbi:ATP-grasp domain-containing protein [Kineosporia babensis]|uniref:ATP-grasp domain-containing protein n=1 Tax=Kineosporia babensis TaxID=499548 RepID=A0A9X1NL43_9ACTN|nr:hypothetical protein [Kineosporia babensis]MCD5315141.1 hypothetical protein [Kineosporia babensis]
MSTLLYVSDLSYPAKGRRYCDEDIYLSARMRAEFDVALCHPLDAANLMSGFDVVVVRNSGPVIHYPAPYQAFRTAALAAGTPVFNQLTGKADMRGKQYLIELFQAGYPVIPTIDRPGDLDRLPPAKQFVAKPKFGADSVGLTFLDSPEQAAFTDQLVQPRIDFRYEVSFYFVDRTLHYALYAPDPARRWQLQRYEPTEADRAFAQRFIDWNDIEHGIQRVDACRTPDGELLLVELEDLNPYLSLDLVAEAEREAFVAAMTRSIQALSAAHR